MDGKVRVSELFPGELSGVTKGLLCLAKEIDFILQRMGTLQNVKQQSDVRSVCLEGYCQWVYTMDQRDKMT